MEKRGVGCRGALVGALRYVPTLLTKSLDSDNFHFLDLALDSTIFNAINC